MHTVTTWGIRIILLMILTAGLIILFFGVKNMLNEKDNNESK